MIEPKIFSVGQINRYIKNLLENDFILSSLLVKGEISNFKAHTTGHLYFTLKDGTGAISCVMFHRDAALMPFSIENGMSVIVGGHVSLYEKTGQYQLYAEVIEPLGVGALQLAYEQLKQKLAQEGLFDGDYKRELPETIGTIAIITSPTGAAVRDVIQIVKRRDPRVKIAIFPALVQGIGAGDAIVEALHLVNEWGKADVIILGRGGGSAEDLWAFNEEKVARAIFASEIPVISAVGHETDYTIADFVADLRAPTPSAAAELATTPLLNRMNELTQLENRLWRNVSAIFEGEKRRFALLKERPVLKRPLERIQNTQLFLSQKEHLLTKEILRKLSGAGEGLLRLEGRLTTASPLWIMGRGYTLVTDAKGSRVGSVEQAEIGDTLRLQLRDGWLKAKITEKAVLTDGEEKADI